MEIHELQQLLSEMSLQEKIGQMVPRPCWILTAIERHSKPF